MVYESSKLNVTVAGFAQKLSVMRLKYLLIIFLLFQFETTTSLAQAEVNSAQRIVTLSPHLAELVFLLGAGDRLQGVSEFSDYPQEVKHIPLIGGAAGFDLEKILSIKPDLVLSWQGGTRDSSIQKMKSLGLRVVSIKGELLEDIPESIKILGEILGQQQRSSLLIAKYNKHLRDISEKYKKKTSHRVFIEISTQPLMGLTNLHPFSAGLKLCGLDNIFSDRDKAAIVTDLESILSRKVGLVLLRQKSNKPESVAREKFYRISNDSTVTFLSFYEDAAFRQTPRLLDAVDEVCQSIHGL